MRMTPGSPLYHRYKVDEYDGEFRESEGHFLRLYPSRLALVYGRWHHSSLTPQERLERLVAARGIDLYTEDGRLDPRYERAARETIAAHAASPSDEWVVLQAVGLDQ
jgi:hypothetical protein